jgi:outer membrane protein assembly factor BamA
LKEGTCDASGLRDRKFLPRPKGGTRLLEGSVEMRFPLGGVFWEGATFLDFGQVWDEDTTPRLDDLEFTPGFGVRYFSPIGPIRVDLGYRFQGGDYLRVVANDIELDEGEWVPTGDLILLDKPVLWGEELGRWTLKRFQLHLSIGQAF